MRFVVDAWTAGGFRAGFLYFETEIQNFLACLHRWAFGGAGNGGSASFSCRQWKYGACKKYRIGVLAQQVTPVEGSR